MCHLWNSCGVSVVHISGSVLSKEGGFGGISFASISGVLQVALSGAPGELNAVSLPLTAFPADKLSTNMQCTPKTGSWY